MKFRTHILSLLLTVSICVELCLISTKTTAECEIILQNKETAILELTDTVNIMEQQNSTYQQQIDTLTAEISTLRQEVERIDKPDRGGEERGERRMMEVTAYDLSYQSCGKYPDHPLYGITASGAYVKEWYTVAAGKSIPFGTKIYIPYFADKPNGGIFTVQDRGGGIGDDQIDVYMADYDDCMEFGRRELEVYILGEEEE